MDYSLHKNECLIWNKHGGAGYTLSTSCFLTLPTIAKIRQLEKRFRRKRS